MGAGRNMGTLASVLSNSSFNPRPAWEPGATLSDTVSATITTGFNPRPAWEPGATAVGAKVRGSASVSILARHGSRAQRVR